MDIETKRRFWAKVYTRGPNGCWTWLASKTSNGYGKFYLEGRLATAHVLAYEEINGPIPNGLEFDHLCKNRACVNPDHLEPVTHQENVLRGDGLTAVHAAKTHCPWGHPYSGTNLYTGPNGNRYCRTCRRASNKAQYYKRKAMQGATP